VGIGDPPRRARDFPHRLSGGMRQRAMIAMALAGNPTVLIADEPTTALDVTIQTQILALLRSVQRETGMSILLITHDLAVVAQAADDACVMYAGRVVERAPVGDLFARPMHPYTQGLIHCIPDLAGDRSRLAVIPGAVSDMACLPPGCRFHPRCELAATNARHADRATVEVTDGSTKRIVLRRCIDNNEAEPGGVPPLRDVRPGHAVACWEV
jgi:oligopeptide/dipeptide ABC transporter ATP-binding protein